MSGGALMSLPAPEMATGAGGRPPASFGKGDIGILNYALTPEYLEAAFYNEATSENRKRRYLKNALGSKAAPRPKFDFMGTAKSRRKFIDTAFVFENTTPTWARS